MSLSAPPTEPQPVTQALQDTNAIQTQDMENPSHAASVPIVPALDLRSLEPVQPPDENLMCPICHSLLIEPVTLPCEHVFCHECLLGALRHQSDRAQACPSCRTPTTASAMTAAPKIVTRILDDVQVRCPLSAAGCAVELPRGSMQSHISFYCGFVVVPCPRSDCPESIERRFTDQDCLHVPQTCDACGKGTTPLDEPRHRRTSCAEEHSECSGCGEWYALSALRSHMEVCLNEIAPCAALPYGCNVRCKRSERPAHEQACPLKQLGPFLERQQKLLEEHAGALRHLRHKADIYEEGLMNVQETLRDNLESSMAQSRASGMDAINGGQTQQLFDMHEALQEEMRRVQTAVSDLDAKIEISAINHAMRANEEKLHRDAVEGQIRKQLQWLLSSRLQGLQQQRPTANTVRKQSAGRGSGPGSLGEGIAGESSSSEAETWGASSTPLRRLSDPSRQNTKL